MVLWVRIGFRFTWGGTGGGILHGLGVKRPYSGYSNIPIPPPLSELRNSDDTEAARRWIDQFKRSSISRDIVQLSFARSSGPGGQNVNKVNTKCTLRCPLSSPWLPLWAKGSLRKSPQYVLSSDSLLLNSSTSRSQAQNVNDCLARLHELVVKASAADVRNEPTELQKQRVLNLQKIQKARKRQEKDHRSHTKQSRSAKGWGE